MSSSLGRKPQEFSLAVIKKTTNNFHKKNHLGRGGEGEVYKGHIQIIDEGDTTVAIKLLKLKSKSHDRFDEEIKLVSGLHHTNLLSLIGYCKESDHKILVYEYMHNGSLAENLYPTCSLEWKVLLNICLGTARGLEYLHHGTAAEHKIIHRDVKPGNILLDQHMGAKLSDFGLLKRGLSSNYQESDPIKTDLRGTRGYYAPEYVYKNEVSRKTDVYAFGVVLLEVLCRKIRPWPLHDESSSDGNKEVKAAAKLQDEDIGKWARRNIATDLKDQISVKCLDMFIDIARGCLLEDPNHRPTMAHVVSILQKSLEFQRKKSSFVLYFSSYNSTSEKVETIVEDSLLIRLILQELLQVNVEEKNVSKYEAYRKELGQKVAKKGANDLCWPLLLLRGEYVGVDRFIQLYRAGELTIRLGGSPISFTCGSCRGANTCHICVWSSRFAVCKVCDTITGLPRDEKEQPSYCPNCQRDQLYLRTLIRSNEATDGIVQLEAWGGEGGDPWSHRVTGEITNIIITYDAYGVNSIKFVCRVGTNSLVESAVFGIETGSRTEIVINSAVERLISIEGSVGTVNSTTRVTSLGFTTSRITHPPVGSGEKESEFSCSLTENPFSGFHGRSSAVLDSIGITTSVETHRESVGPWPAPTGGVPWDYTPEGPIVLISVTFDDDILCSLQFATRDADGVLHRSPIFGRAVDCTHMKEIVIDIPGERIIGIRGVYGPHGGGTFVKSVTFMTDRRSLGPFGAENPGDTPFTYSVQGGDRLGGFYGRSGWLIDCIGAYRQIVGSAKVGPYSTNPEGTSWDYQPEGTISRVFGYSKGGFDIIQFESIDESGHTQTSAPFGTTAFDAFTVPIGRGEWITGISGTCTTDRIRISGLYIYTSTRTYGPYGDDETGTKFSFKVKDGRITGFHGRSKECCHAIGIYVKPN